MEVTNDASLSVFISLEILMLLGILGCYAWRFYSLKMYRVEFSFARILFNLLNIFALVFVLLVLAIGAGFASSSNHLCKVSVNVLIFGYLVSKVLLYLFLSERLHRIQGHKVARVRDFVWQRFTLGLLYTFGELVIVSFIYAEHSTKKGYCTIGLPAYVAGPILGFDVACSLVFSVTFFYTATKQYDGLPETCLPAPLRRLFYKSTGRQSYLGGHRPKSNKSISAIIKQTSVVSLAILISTLVNMVLLLATEGSEPRFMFFLLCSGDITWNIICLTYLVGSSEKGFLSQSITRLKKRISKRTLGLDIEMEEIPLPAALVMPRDPAADLDALPKHAPWPEPGQQQPKVHDHRTHMCNHWQGQKRNEWDPKTRRVLGLRFDSGPNPRYPHPYFRDPPEFG